MSSSIWKSETSGVAAVAALQAQPLYKSFSGSQRQYLFKHEDFEDTALGVIFSFGATNAGAGSAFSVQGSEQSHPGISRFSTGTTATGRSGIISQAKSVSFGDGKTTLEAVIRIPTLSNVTEEFQFAFGFVDGVAAALSVDSVNFRYDRATDGDFWLLITRNNNVETKIVTAIPVVAAQWYRLRIEVNASGTSVAFYIDGVLAGTIATNIPGSAGRETGVGGRILKSVGTTARFAEIDYVEVGKELTSSR